MIVAKIEISDMNFADGSCGSYYAVIPKKFSEEYDEVRLVKGGYGYSFMYFDIYNIAIFARSADGYFTAEEENEIISILSSFSENID